MTRMPFSVAVRKFLSNDMAQDRGERNRTVPPSWESEVEFVVLHILISGHILLHIKLVPRSLASRRDVLLALGRQDGLQQPLR
jgi:hypothetical protein